jgi:signal transduction histidine kinase
MDRWSVILQSLARCGDGVATSMVPSDGHSQSAAAEPGIANAASPAPAQDDERRFDLVLFLRHLAITVGAIVAYLLQSELDLGWAAFAIVTSSAALNFGCSFLHRRPGFEAPSEIASSVIGVGCWTALVFVTGGVTSPFIAGLWLEIILAAMLFALRGIAAVTLWSITSVWALQLWFGLGGHLVTLALQSGFLAGMGGLTYGVARNAQRTEQRLVQERDDLDDRLHSLEEQLESERAVGRIGEGVARLAHGLKNAVHSLRGFVSLIEPTLGDRSDSAAAMAGLRTAIDDLEALARLTLEEGEEKARLPIIRCRADAVVERAVREISIADAGVDWSIDNTAPNAEPAIAADKLQEVLLILLRNAVEAMRGNGRGAVNVQRNGDSLHIRVSDSGPGIEPAQAAEIFKPGYTTKPEGSGYGLFLAHRILSEARGTLEARSGNAGGAVLDLSLPIAAPAHSGER